MTDGGLLSFGYGAGQVRLIAGMISMGNATEEHLFGGIANVRSVVRGRQPCNRLEALTVKTHVSNILTKLNLQDRVQAAIFAHERSRIVSEANAALSLVIGSTVDALQPRGSIEAAVGVASGRLSQCAANGARSPLTTITFLGERRGTIDPDAAVTAARQTTEPVYSHRRSHPQPALLMWGIFRAPDPSNGPTEELFRRRTGGGPSRAFTAARESFALPS